MIRLLYSSLVLFIALTPLAPLPVSAAAPGEASLPGADLCVSVSYGRSYVSGYYRDFLADGNFIAASLIYPLPYRFLLTEGEFLASGHDIRENGPSEMKIYAFRAGALLYYPLATYFQPYGGLFLQETYVILDAGRINERETAYKPGIALKAGFFTSVYSFFGVRAGVEYYAIDLSHERLNEFSFTVSAVINTTLTSRFSESGKADKARELGEVESIFRRGLEEMSKGDLPPAESSFRKVLSMKPGHADAEKKIEEIKQVRESYDEARKLIAQKKPYDAIPLLERSRPYMKAAEKEIANLRGQLSAEIPGLERKGIDAYENRDYDNCIAIMNKILAVDPDNQTGKLYLPRAHSRKQAIDRLK